MTTTLSAHSSAPAAATLVSPEKKLQLNALRTTVAQFREALADPHIDDTTKMYVQSEAIESIERQLKPLLGNVMKLMNSPLGFKTDRPPGGKDRNGNPVQRDELVDLCDRAIDKTSGLWRAGGENQMRREVAALVAKVKAFKALQEQAKITGAPEPDEMLEDWAWAIPTEGQPDWDPSLETLWEFGIRTKGMAAPEPSVDQFAWNP